MFKSNECSTTQKNQDEKYLNKFSSNEIENENIQVAIDKKSLKEVDNKLRTQEKYLRLQGEKERLDSLKHSFIDTRIDSEQLSRIKMQYVEELEQYRIKERRLLSEVETYQLQLSNQSGEIMNFRIKERSTKDELEFLKNSLHKSKNDINESLSKYVFAEEEINILNKEVKKYASKVTILSTESQEVRTSINIQLKAITELEELNIRMKDSESLLKLERETLQRQLKDNFETIRLRDLTIETLCKQSESYQSNFALVSKSKQELRNKSRDQLSLMEARNEDLQFKIDEAEIKLNAFKENESILKANIAHTLNENKVLIEKTRHLSNEALILQSNMDEERENHYSSFGQQEDLSNAYHVLQKVKNTLESENYQLKIQVNQKHSKGLVLLEKVDSLRALLRDQMEERRAELVDSKVSGQTDASIFQSQLNGKDREIKLIKSKYESTRELNRRLKEDLEQYRTINTRKEVDMSSLQNNVNTLSEILKNRVDSIIEKTLEHL